MREVTETPRVPERAPLPVPDVPGHPLTVARPAARPSPWAHRRLPANPESWTSTLRCPAIALPAAPPTPLPRYSANHSPHPHPWTAPAARGPPLRGAALQKTTA